MAEIPTVAVLVLMFAGLVGAVLFGWVMGRGRSAGDRVAETEATNTILNEGPVDLMAVMSDCVRAVQGRADAKAVSLKLSLPDTLPVLRADAGMVHQMLSALLSIAIDSTPAEGWIVVTAGYGRCGLDIAVADTGSGIPSEQASKVKTWIELHGGDFQCNSLVGRGTTVALTFPPERVGTAITGEVPGGS
ncbi:MAG: HAMP domain-containing histidine kinase [Rhodospirillales bacterium]|nr:HAMP domain-containing histidine kinase [Rhodospirillales bacterium]